MGKVYFASLLSFLKKWGKANMSEERLLNGAWKLALDLGEVNPIEKNNWKSVPIDVYNDHIDYS